MDVVDEDHDADCRGECPKDSRGGRHRGLRHGSKQRTCHTARAGAAGAAGISPLDVIRIATFNSAVFLGKADQLGSVEAGKLADLVLLSKDPTADINNAKSIVFVMKNGQIIDESQLPLAGGQQKRRFSAN